MCGVCDRAAAREARTAARELLLEQGVAISPACSLHPSHDRLLPHEQLKSSLGRAQWRCSKCSKLFRSERHLDLHLERKHAALLEPNATVCLGEYCDMLRCPSWLVALRKQPGGCDDQKLMARRHFCQHLLHDCLVQGTPGSLLLFERLDHTICQPLRCEARALLRAGRTLPGVAAAQRASAAAATAEHGPLYYGLATALLLGLATFYGVSLWRVSRSVAWYLSRLSVACR